MTSIKVTLRSGEKMELAAEEGVSLMEIARDGGVGDIVALCGGCCACATCHVFVSDEWFGALPAMSDDENELLDSLPNRARGSRLSCQLSFVAELDGLCMTVAPED